MNLDWSLLQKIQKLTKEKDLKYLHGQLDFMEMPKNMQVSSLAQNIALLL